MTDPMMTPAGSAPSNNPEIESGKTMAILCYLPVSPVNLIVTIVCLAQKNNAYSLYHAKQSMALFICFFIAMAISIALICVVIGLVLYPLVLLSFFVLSIIGIVNAAGAKYKPLPLVGGFGERWFAGIKKA